MAHYRGAAMPNNFGTGSTGRRGRSPQGERAAFVPKYHAATGGHNSGRPMELSSNPGPTQFNNPGATGGGVPPQGNFGGRRGNTGPGVGGGGGGGMGTLGDMGSQMMMQHGRQMLQNEIGQQTTRLLACLNITPLKVYFAVDNGYVIHKLRLILCPFRHASWRRMHDTPPGLGGIGVSPPTAPSDPALYKPPKIDVNAPDLYIPTMAFITYILLFAYALGLDNRFTPEVVSLTASWAMASMFIEVLIFWGGFWFLNVEANRRPYLLDLLAYTSYKFVGVILGMISGIAFGAKAYYAVTLLFGATMGIFLMKSLGHVTTTYDGTANQRRYFLAFMALLQILLAYILSRSSLPTVTAPAVVDGGSAAAAS
ncbi:hypothetical protein AAMO2058_001383700 [Amorphochlora amoebiformis]